MNAEKRAREDEEKAVAAEKAKRAEFDDMRFAVDDAKEARDSAQAQLTRMENDLATKDCEPDF
jgi:hypothetical protein